MYVNHAIVVIFNVYFNVIRENRILVKKSEYIGF